MDCEACVGHLGDRDERLQRQMQHLLGAEGVLEDVIGFRKSARGVAASQMEVESDIGIGLPLQMLEIGKGTRRLEHVVHDRRRGHRLDLVEHGRQLVILGDDRLCGSLRHVRVGREHHRDRLADIVHLAGGKDRLVVEGRAVERVRHHLAHVVDADHAVDAGERARRARVERADAPVGDRAAEDFSVEHAGQADVVYVFGAAGYLGRAFQARHRASHLSACRGRHQCACPASSAARNARAT